MRRADLYMPPFVTETDEPVKDDCAVCTGLMLAADWTLGEATDSPRGPVMDRMQLKRFREHMRDRLPPGKQHGGLAVSDLVEVFRETWPNLPALRAPRLPFDAMWMSLSHGHRVGLWGNPAEIRKPSSPLRQWTINDDFGHVIRVGPSRVRAGHDEAWVMDPLGHGFVHGPAANPHRYRGQWVAREQVRQFAFLDPGSGGGIVRSMVTVPVGGASLR